MKIARFKSPAGAVEAAKRFPPRTNREWARLTAKRDNRTGGRRAAR